MIVKIINPTLGVPVTYVDKQDICEFLLIGHDHDLGNGIGVREGKFEVDGIGKFTRILIKRR